MISDVEESNASATDSSTDKAQIATGYVSSHSISHYEHPHVTSNDNRQHLPIWIPPLHLFFWTQHQRAPSASSSSPYLSILRHRLLLETSRRSSSTSLIWQMPISTYTMMYDNDDDDGHGHGIRDMGIGIGTYQHSERAFGYCVGFIFFITSAPEHWYSTPPFMHLHRTQWRHRHQSRLDTSTLTLASTKLADDGRNFMLAWIIGRGWIHHCITSFTYSERASERAMHYINTLPSTCASFLCP